MPDTLTFEEIEEMARKDDGRTLRHNETDLRFKVRVWDSPEAVERLRRAREQGLLWAGPRPL